MPLSDKFNNMLFLTNKHFIDFFINDNFFKCEFSDYFIDREQHNLYSSSVYTTGSGSINYSNYDDRINFTAIFEFDFAPKIEIFKVLKIGQK